MKKKLGFQHNDKDDDDLKYWVGILTPAVRDRSSVEFDYPPQTAAFKFRLNFLPPFAQIDEGKSVAVKLPPNQQSLVKFSGRLFPEPSILFAMEAGWSPKADTFPLRGLLKNGPFDLSTVRSLPDPEVRLSIICPKTESRMLSNFLATYNQKIVVEVRRQGEYVVDYNGFSDIFRCEFVVPRESDSNWVSIPEIANTNDVTAGCRSAHTTGRVPEMIDLIDRPRNSFV